MTTDYDTFAAAYSRDNETNLLNGHYERPAMIDLAGDVAGHRVLDAGCGSGPLTELRRVLRPGGRVILSVNHPSAYLVNHRGSDYFATTQHSDTFTFDGQEAVLTYWHRPLHAMTDAFTQAGFRLRVVSEPPYAVDTPPELLPPGLGERTAFVCFLFFVLEAP